MDRRLRTALSLAGIGAGTLVYASGIERNLFTLRRFTAPVLTPGARPIRLLHVSDLHLRAAQHRKQRWISDLARLQPDLVVNTGDTSSDPDGIDAIMRTLGPLFDFPGVFVPGNNDYWVPELKNPARYFLPDKVGNLDQRRAMPWAALAYAMATAGWHDLTHAWTTVKVADAEVFLAGTDDPHLGKDRFSLIEGHADPSAVVRIGVTHSPEPRMLRSFSRDGYDLMLAGHTHGGQIRVPFGPAIVTNCGIDRNRARWLHRWDERLWFNVCAGTGTNPYMPFRLGCRPEAVLLTLIGREA